MINYRPVSLRFYSASVDSVCGPDGRIVDLLPHRPYDTWLDAGGKYVLVSYYFTDCTKGITQNYDSHIFWDANEPDCWPRYPNDGTTPCPYHCSPPSEDMTDWVSRLPASWDNPVMAASSTSVLAASDGADLWWR